MLQLAIDIHFHENTATQRWRTHDDEDAVSIFEPFDAFSKCTFATHTSTTLRLRISAHIFLSAPSFNCGTATARAKKFIFLIYTIERSSMYTDLNFVM